MPDPQTKFPVDPNAVQIVLALARSAPLQNTDAAEQAIDAQKQVWAYFQKLFNPPEVEEDE